MQIQPTVQRRVDAMDRAKANRIRSVETLPERGEQGDGVWLKDPGQLYLWTDGGWQSADAHLQGQLDELHAWRASMEGDEDG